MLSFALVDNAEVYPASSKLRVIQSNNNGYPKVIKDRCWSGLKSFTADNEKETRYTLFIFKRKDGCRDLSCFDSMWTGEIDNDNKYIFEVTSPPKVLMDANIMVHLMSPKDVKLEAVALVERLGK